MSEMKRRVENAWERWSQQKLENERSLYKLQEEFVLELGKPAVSVLLGGLAYPPVQIPYPSKSTLEMVVDKALRKDSAYAKKLVG